EVQCPNFTDHTPSPDGYIEWHAWARKMGKTHQQRRCSGCGLFAIWEPKPPRKINERGGDPDL
ncbi:hypothetical protein JYG43_23760, partial [Escherichia fergusonii]|uniref:hypothetical protein n=1 Tax=Escherichia fergusonii TaxID=564 RepID=UPI001CBDFD5F